MGSLGWQYHLLPPESPAHFVILKKQLKEQLFAIKRHPEKKGSPLIASTASAGNDTMSSAFQGVDGMLKSTFVSTMWMTASAAGEKLPLFLIFKAKRNARVHKEVTGDVINKGFPPSVVMTVQSLAWSDITIMKEWVQRVWRPWISSRSATHSYLIMDVFSAHTNGEVIEAFEQLRTEVGSKPIFYCLLTGER
jgi:hypothetical protein